MYPRSLLALCLLLFSMASLFVAARPAPAHPRIALAVMAAPMPTLSPVGNLGGIARAVAVDRTQAYLLEGTSLLVLDIRNPAQPRQLASLPLPGPGQDLFVTEGLAYLALGTHGLLIVDVRNPSAPTVRSRLAQAGTVQSVFVVGVTVYLATGASGLQIVDASDSARPVVRGSAGAFNARDVFVSGVYAYVADSGGLLRTIDVRNPAQPVPQASYPAQEVYAVSVVGTRAYMLARTGTGRSGEATYGLVVGTVPLAPGGALPTPGAANTCVQPHGSFVYTCDGVYSIQQNPDQPVWVGMYGTDGAMQHAGITAAGATLYVALAGFQIYDLSNPASPVLRGAAISPGFVKQTERAGNLLYVADLFNGWQIVDVTDPTRPRLVSWDPFYASDVQVAGNRAYLGGTALRVYDVTNPASPTLLGSYPVVNGATDLEVSGSTAYINNFFGVTILDVSNPANIRPLSEIRQADETDTVDALAVEGALAYVLTRSSFKIYDVTNPASPALRGSLPLANFGASLRIVGGRAYVSDMMGLLRIVDVQNPAAPQLLGTYLSQVETYEVEVIGELALLATKSGVQVVDVRDPAVPVLRNDVPLLGGALSIHLGDGLLFVGSSVPSPREGVGLRILRLLNVIDQQFLPQLVQ